MVVVGRRVGTFEPARVIVAIAHTTSTSARANTIAPSQAAGTGAGKNGKGRSQQAWNHSPDIVRAVLPRTRRNGTYGLRRLPSARVVGRIRDRRVYGGSGGLMAAPSCRRTNS